MWMGSCNPTVWFMLRWLCFLHKNVSQLNFSLSTSVSLTLSFPYFSPWKSERSGLIHKSQGVIFTACRHMKVRRVKCSWWLCQMAALASRCPCQTSVGSKCHFHHPLVVYASTETATVRIQSKFGRWQRVVCADISGVRIKQVRRQNRTASR